MSPWHTVKLSEGTCHRMHGEKAGIVNVSHQVEHAARHLLCGNLPPPRLRLDGEKEQKPPLWYITAANSFRLQGEAGFGTLVMSQWWPAILCLDYCFLDDNQQAQRREDCG